MFAKYVGFQHLQTGRVGMWVVSPCGATQSLVFFHGMTKAVVYIVNQLIGSGGVAAITLVHVNDLLSIARSHEDVRKVFDVMDDLNGEFVLSWGPRTM